MMAIATAAARSNGYRPNYNQRIINISGSTTVGATSYVSSQRIGHKFTILGVTCESDVASYLSSCRVGWSRSPVATELDVSMGTNILMPESGGGNQAFAGSIIYLTNVVYILPIRIDVPYVGCYLWAAYTTQTGGTAANMQSMFSLELDPGGA